MVLLKNNGLLPLKTSVKRILVVGPLADQVQVLLGNYNGQPSHAVTALDGIKAAFPGSQVTFEPGTNFLRLAEAVPTAALKTPDGEPGVKAEYFRFRGFVRSAAWSPKSMRGWISPCGDRPRRARRGARRKIVPLQRHTDAGPGRHI